MAHGCAAVAVLVAGSPASNAAVPEAPRVEVSFRLEGFLAARDDLSGALRLTPRNGAAEAVAVPLRAGVAPQASLPSGSRWLVTAEIPGLWARPASLILLPDAEPPVHGIELWPAAEIRGRLRLAKAGARLPSEVTLTLGSPPGPVQGRRVPQTVASCGLDAEGRFACPVPATSLDLGLAAEGFAPHHLWGLDLPAGSRRDLGTLELRPGASVAGWVESESGQPLPAESRVALELLQGPGGGDPALRVRLQDARLEARLAPGGFFQLTGVPPGAYSLTAETPGFAPASVAPLEVWQGKETLLREPLRLSRPFAVEVEIRPALDWTGKPWHLRAHWASPTLLRYGEPLFDDAVDESGRARLRGLAPGRLWLQVHDATGNLMASLLDHPMPGPEAADVEIAIEQIFVSGSLLLGEEPLAGRLFWGGKHGAPSFEAEADEEGRFSAVLPQAGSWPVEVEAEEPRLAARTRVRVEPDRHGAAKVEVRLPDTRVFGRVVDEQGGPVEGARVSATPEGEWVMADTGPDGAFEIRALPPGRVVVAASRRRQVDDESSPAVHSVVVEGQTLGPLELRLEGSRPVTGWLESDRGPVVGASLRFRASDPPGGGSAQARSDLDGAFTARLPKRARRASVVVSAPGHALRAYEVLTDGTPLRFQVPLAGGTLRVALPPDVEALAERGQTVGVFQNGVHIPRQVLWEWARGHGWQTLEPREMVVPNLAAGEYQACLLPGLFDAAELLPFLAGQQPGCVTGTLLADGELRLVLPDTSP